MEFWLLVVIGILLIIIFSLVIKLFFVHKTVREIEAQFTERLMTETNAICCAHLLRELNDIEENHPEQTWVKEFKNLLLEMKKVKDKVVAQEKEAVSYYYLHKFDKRYDEIIQQAYEENPLPESTSKKRGRKKKTKVLNLVGRLENYKESVCLFIKNLSVPFDNNQAERDLRMIKVKTKVSGCFRSEEGAQE